MIRRIGISLIILGLAITVVTLVNMLTRDEVVDIADIEVVRDSDSYMAWTPAIGFVVMFVGGGVALYGARRDRLQTTKEKR